MTRTKPFCVIGHDDHPAAISTSSHDLARQSGAHSSDAKASGERWSVPSLVAAGCLTPRHVAAEALELEPGEESYDIECAKVPTPSATKSLAGHRPHPRMTTVERSRCRCRQPRGRRSRKSPQGLDCVGRGGCCRGVLSGSAGHGPAGNRRDRSPTPKHFAAVAATAIPPPAVRTVAGVVGGTTARLGLRPPLRRRA